MGIISSCQKTPVIPMMTSLTPEQIAIIQSTWAVPAQNPEDSGEAILYAFFEKYPKNIEKFSSFRNTPLLSLKGTPGFRSHAGKIVGVFDETVKSLTSENYIEQMEGIWNKIGNSHNRRKISRQSFEELREVLISVMVKEFSLNEQAQEAWKSLFDIAYHTLFGKIDEKTPY